MKAAMELEYVMKLIIMLVVVAAVIALIWTFYGSIQVWWCKFMGTCSDDPTSGQTEVIRQSLFTTTDVAKYSDSCWFGTGKDYSGDLICYVLQGRFEVVPDEIASQLKAFPKDKLVVETDFRGDSAIIKFIDLGNQIEIS
ncbi:MAG: hypothetical protein ABIH90_01190 [Candidatus Aenigmatarchaeota archaeon]